MKSRWILAAFALCLVSSLAHADGNSGTPINTGTIASRFLSAGSNWSGVEWLNFCGYNSCSDGGGGLFHKENCGTVDGGKCIADSGGHKFARQNLNGHLAQYGITVGSLYDCSLSTGYGVSLCSDAAPVVKKAFTAAIAADINVVSGDGVQFQLASDGSGGTDPFVIDGNVCLDNATDAGDIAITDPSTVTGVVWLGDVTTLQLSNGGCFQYGALVNAWYGIHYPTGAASIADKFAVVNHMVSAGKTGITATGGGASLHHAGVFGFDTGVDARGPRLNMDHISFDADVGLYVHDVGATLTIDGFADAGSLTGGAAATEYFSISNVTDNGTGAHLCRVQLRALSGGHPLSDIADGMMMYVSGLTPTTGGINAWGRYNITKISSDTFDEPGSVCNGANLNGPSFTADTTSGSTYLTNVSSFANLRRDMVLTQANIPVGTTIAQMWENKGIIVMSAAATGTAATATVASKGGTFVFPNAVECDGSDGAAGAPCGVLSAVLRPLAGNSAGGVAAGNVGTGVMCGGTVPGGGGLTDVKVATLKMNNAQMYGLGTAFNFNNCVKAEISNFHYDSIRKVKDDLTAFANITGKTQNIAFYGSGAGKIGFGVTINAEDTDTLHKAQILAVSTNLQDIELDGGALVMTGGNLNNAFIANAATAFSVTGYNGNLKIYYEGAAARAISDTSGTTPTTGASWYGGYLQPGMMGQWDARANADDSATVTTAVLQAALDYASAHGIPVVKLGAQSARITGNITIPNFVTLDLGAANVGKLTTTGDYRLSSGIMGALGLTSSATITCGVGSGIINGNILADGGSYSPTTFYAQTTRDGQNAQAAQATSGTAITASSPSCRLQNLSILGFNVGVAISKQHVKMVDVFIDSKTCVSFSGAEDDQLDRVICKSLLTQGVDKSAALLYADEVGGGDHQYEITWDVSAATYTFTNGDKFYFVPAAGGGAESAAGSWTISGATTRANGVKGCNRVAGCPGGVLTSSSKAATTASATWSNSADAAGDYFVTINPASVGTISVGQAVSGTNIAANVTVADVWPGQGRIYLTAAGSPFTGAGVATTLTFTDHAWTSSSGFIEAGERTGAGFDCLNSSGIKLTDSTAYAHDIELHAYDGCRNIRIVNFTTGTNDSSLDDGMIGFLIDGTHAGNDPDSIYVVNCNCGQHANVGFRIDTTSPKPNFIASTVAAPSTAHIKGTALDVEDGDIVIDGLNTGGGAANVFISDLAFVSARGITNAMSHFYVKTPYGTTLDGSNNQCSVPKVCNHSQTADAGSVTLNGHGIPAPIAAQFNANTAPAGGVSNFLPINSTSAPAQTEAQVRSYAPYTGTIRNLQVRINAAPGGGHNVVITLRQGVGAGALTDTTLTCTIADPALLCSDLTHSVAVTQGDYLDWSITYDGVGATGGRVNITGEYDSQ